MGVIFLLGIPIIVAGIIDVTSMGNQTINALVATINYASQDMVINTTFTTGFGALMILINLIPWLFYWIAIKFVYAKLFITPQKNWASQLGIVILKILIYPTVFVLVLILVFETNNITATYLSIQNAAEFKVFFETCSRYVQLTIFLTYVITIFLNAYIHSLYVPPPAVSPLQYARSWIQEKWQNQPLLPEETDTIRQTEEIFDNSNQSSSTAQRSKNNVFLPNMNVSPSQ